MSIQIVTINKPTEFERERKLRYVVIRDGWRVGYFCMLENARQFANGLAKRTPPNLDEEV